jgi:hypothetical protein
MVWREIARDGVERRVGCLSVRRVRNRRDGIALLCIGDAAEVKDEIDEVKIDSTSHRNSCGGTNVADELISLSINFPDIYICDFLCRDTACTLSV